MLRLIISDIECEVYENAPVNLKFQYSDLEKIQSSLGSYSQTFRVPLTKKNRDIFGDIDEATLVAGSEVYLDLKQRLAASLWSDGTPLIEGFVQVKKIYLTKEQFAEVELVFFSGALDLKSEIGGGLLSELDLSSFDHELNWTNVTNSWTASTGIAPQIRYGLIDKGQNWEYPDRPISTDSTPLPLSELTPFIRAKTLFDTIMDEAGFTYESTQLTSADFEQMYVPLYNGTFQPISTDNENQNVYVVTPSDQSITSSETFVDYSEACGSCYDPEGNWNDTANVYTAPVSGLYDIVLRYSWDNANWPITTWKIRLKVNSVAVIDKTIDGKIGQSHVEALSNYPLGAGDTIHVTIQRTSGSFTPTFKANTNSLRVDLKESLAGYDIDVATNLPEMKQIDFITSLQKMFNLVFVPDRNRPNHLIIETFEDYFTGGANKDWTNKVDYNKDFVMAPTTDIQAQVYGWTYSEGKDFVADSIQKTLNRVYGEFKVYDTTNAFATGEKIVKNGFAPFLMSLIPNSAVPIRRAIDAKGDGISQPKANIAYWCGTSDIYGTQYLVDETATTQTRTTLPFFSNYNVVNPDIGDKDLNYGQEIPLYDVTAIPAQNLYIRFWGAYVRELYSTESRVVDCYLRLNEADIADWDFTDVIYIKDTKYRILSLEYDANAPGLAKARLIRRFDDLSFCADTPTSIDVRSGFILFNGSTSASPDWGNATCCVAYGYEWGGWVVGGVGVLRCTQKTGTIKV